jgi:XTP/dITP diphosphohydrolase
MELVFATQNQNKVIEVRSVLPGWLNVLSLKDLGLTEELQEDHDTLEENALQKVKFVFERFGKPCFSEDAGLEVKRLGGQPGVRSARYAGEGKSSNDNIELLLKNLSGVDDRVAQFRAVIAFYDGSQSVSFEGICEGSIAKQPAGPNGFGYDPVFIPKGYDNTFGELPSDVKHRISHRTKAMELFISFIEKLKRA